MNNQDLFENLSREGIQTTEEQRKNINRRINEVLNYEPKVGVFGKTGVGKSSLCNALFGQDVCEISDVKSCTRNPQEVLLQMGGKKLLWWISRVLARTKTVIANTHSCTAKSFRNLM